MAESAEVTLIVRIVRLVSTTKVYSGVGADIVMESLRSFDQIGERVPSHPHPPVTSTSALQHRSLNPVFPWY